MEPYQQAGEKSVPGGRPVFHYLHRERVFNSADGVYMGRERKRGAVEALLDCAAHGDTHEFCCNYPDICSEKERFRFLVVLDADTIMPNGALPCLKTVRRVRPSDSA